MLICANLNQPWSSPSSTLTLLRKCQTSRDVNQVHSRLITTGFINNISLTTNIVLAFACSHYAPLVEFARYVFFKHYADLGFRRRKEDPFLWNAIIKSYSHGCDPKGALRVFCSMLEDGVCVDRFSLSLVLKGCSRLGLVGEGMQIHGFLRKTRLGLDLFLQNCLIGFYLKCGCLGYARQVFDRMLQRDSVSYNSMIDGYVKFGLIESARDLFDLMPREEKNLISWNSMISGYAQTEGGLEKAWDLFDEMPVKDLISWNSMIDGCVKQGKMEEAQALFDAMPERDVFAWASMVDGYSKLGQVEIAKTLYDQMPQRDAVACNSMMAGYIQNGHCAKALETFNELRREGRFSPDETTLLIALSAIAQLGKIDKGMEIHPYIVENEFCLSTKLGVALIDMYSKCGSIQSAMQVFEEIKEKSVDHWNAMIGGLAIHGLGELAFTLLIEMERLRVEPDDITFIGLLSACGHSGLVKEGLICFELMRKKHRIKPKLKHCGCMVDLLARSGSIVEATKFVEEMPFKPNDVIWRTLLSACNNHMNFKDGGLAAQHLIAKDSHNPSSYVLLSNMYATLGMWSSVQRVRSAMKRQNLKKVPGCSWIELDGRVHQFFVQDKSHSQATEIYTLLDSFLKPNLEITSCI